MAGFGCNSLNYFCVSIYCDRYFKGMGLGLDMRKSIIKKWAIVNRTANPYQAPELGAPCITGNVYGDTRCGEGETITTSRIKNINLKEMTVQTKNTLYDLGDVSSSFEAYMKENGFTIIQYVESINDK